MLSKEQKNAMGVVYRELYGRRRKKSRAKQWLQWFRRLFPHVVSHQAFYQLKVQLPKEQRRVAIQRMQLGRLNVAHKREIDNHAAALREKEELKALLRIAAPDHLEAWQTAKRAGS